MQQIDFLPAQYRQRYARRQAQPWQILVVVTVVAVMAAAAVSQSSRRSRVRRELDAVAPKYDLAVSRNAQLAKIQAELETARTRAELFTYLRHPWPRTQLLAAMLAPLPDEITLGHLQITRELPRDQSPNRRRSRAQRKEEEDQLANLPPAARDLKRLRDECDKMETVVLISGVTTDGAAVHRYLGELAKTSLFCKAELDSSESVQGDRPGTEQFHARLVVRWGYGQPGGPTGPEENSLAQANHRE